MISEEKINELVGLCERAKDASSQFSDAIKSQAELNGLAQRALRRFVVAKHRDALADLDSEADDLAKLLGI